MGGALADTGAIIVTHRRADLARACAERVLTEVDRRLIVVVVNDPRHASESDLEWLGVNVGLVVFNQRLRGYGANVNEAARHLRGRCQYYLVLNDDVLPAGGTIAALRAALESDPTVAIAAPQLIDSHGVPQPVAYQFPSIGSELTAALMLPAHLTRWLWDRFVLGGGSGAQVWLAGAILLVRATAFHEIEGFDEQFFLYCEETDLAFRMADRGWSAALCAGISAVHLGAESTGDRRYRHLMGLSRRRYVRKHWRRRERTALPVLLALVYAWNSIYVLGRIVLEPASLRSKLSLWQAHWESRTAPRSGIFGWGLDA
jgi:N-acetylglucosaminyl-diphospho-decaprenol L-rhamnosyltransferase